MPLYFPPYTSLSEKTNRPRRGALFIELFKYLFYSIMDLRSVNLADLHGYRIRYEESLMS